MMECVLEEEETGQTLSLNLVVSKTKCKTPSTITSLNMWGHSINDVTGCFVVKFPPLTALSPGVPLGDNAKPHCLVSQCKLYKYFGSLFEMYQTRRALFAKKSCFRFN